MRRFLFHLAARFQCTVEEIGKRMSCAEFAEWYALHRIDNEVATRGGLAEGAVAGLKIARDAGK